MRNSKILSSLVKITTASLLIGCTEFEIPIPKIETIEVTNITEASALTGGLISSDNGNMVSERGICCNTNPNPTLEDNVFKDEDVGPGKFDINLMELSPNTTYFVRAYATNKGGTAYGEQKTFTTKSLELITTPITFITANSAISGGMVSFDSNWLEVISRGICWNTSPNPTTSNSTTMDGGGKGSFSSNLTNLKASTTYYIRAYLTSLNGVKYGNELSFITQNGIMGITTDSASSITSTSASIAGSINEDGGSNVTERGIYWSSSANPNISGQKLISGSGKGEFSSTITGLKQNTIYYVCAFGTNGLGTTYGNVISFTTQNGVPKACFDYSNSNGYLVSFTNCSDYPTTCLWDFGDGTTSTENNPTHKFGSFGSFNVKLTVSNYGLEDFVTKAVSISDVVSLNNLVVTPYVDGALVRIDVDYDGIIDIELFKTIYGGFISGNGYMNIISPKNKYEVFIDSIFTTVYHNSNYTQSTEKFFIPKIFNLGDIIKYSDQTKNGLLIINADWQMYHEDSYTFNTWPQNEIRYIGFRKIVDSKTKIGWIKLKVTSGVTLLSFKIPTEADYLTIDK